MAAVIASIDAEIRREQNRPLGTVVRTLKVLLEKPDLADVTDLPTARSASLDTWISQGATPGLIAILFPNDPTASRKAKQAQNKLQVARRRAVAPAATQAAARFGIVGRGSAVLDRLMREHFAGRTVEQAVQLGPAAWLEAGVSEAVARQLFDEPTAREARRRSDARGNARRNS